MSRDRAARMGIVLKLAVAKQQQAAAALAALSARIASEQERLTQLQQLREEYLDNLRVKPGTCRSVQGLQHGMTVILQLDNLAGNQDRMLKQLLIQQAGLRQKLEQCWLRCRNLERLQQQFRQQQEAEQEKRSMKIMENDRLARSHSASLQPDGSPR